MSGGICRRCGATASDGRCTLCGGTQIDGTPTPAPSASRPGPPVAPTAPPPPNLHRAASVAASRPRSKAPAIAIGVIGTIAVIGIIGGALAMKRPPTNTVASGGQPATSARATGAGLASAPSGGQGVGRAHTSLRSGTWVAVLESLPKSDVTEASAASRIAEFGGAGPVELVDTDAIPGLNSGYWTLAIIGASSKEAARATCARVGREVGPECYPREIG